MFGLGVGELALILVILVVVFGAGRLAAVGGDLGKAIRDFRREMAKPDAIDVSAKDESKPGDPPRS